MFESDIERIKLSLVERILTAQPFIHLQDVLQHPEIDIAYKAYFDAEFSWWLYEDKMSRYANLHADTNHPAIQQLHSHLDVEYHRTARFDRVQTQTIIDSSVKSILNYRVRPRVTLKWFVFRGEPTKPIYEVLLRMAYFSDYYYLHHAFKTWLDERKLTTESMDIISVVEFEKLMKKIDDDIILELSPLQFVELIAPLFSFFNSADVPIEKQVLPIEALIVFLDDKEIQIIAQKLERMLYQHAIRYVTRDMFLNVLDEVLSEVEHIQGTNDYVQTTFPEFTLPDHSLEEHSTVESAEIKDYSLDTMPVDVPLHEQVIELDSIDTLIDENNSTAIEDSPVSENNIDADDEMTNAITNEKDDVDDVVLVDEQTVVIVEDITFDMSTLNTTSTDVNEVNIETIEPVEEVSISSITDIESEISPDSQETVLLVTDDVSLPDSENIILDGVEEVVDHYTPLSQPLDEDIHSQSVNDDRNNHLANDTEIDTRDNSEDNSKQPEHFANISVSEIPKRYPVEPMLHPVSGLPLAGSIVASFSSMNSQSSVIEFHVPDSQQPNIIETSSTLTDEDTNIKAQSLTTQDEIHSPDTSDDIGEFEATVDAEISAHDVEVTEVLPESIVTPNSAFIKSEVESSTSLFQKNNESVEPSMPTLLNVPIFETFEKSVGAENILQNHDFDSSNTNVVNNESEPTNAIIDEIEFNPSEQLSSETSLDLNYSDNSNIGTSDLPVQTESSELPIVDNIEIEITDETNTLVVENPLLDTVELGPQNEITTDVSSASAETTMSETIEEDVEALVQEIPQVDVDEESAQATEVHFPIADDESDESLGADENSIMGVIARNLVKTADIPVKLTTSFAHDPTLEAVMEISRRGSILLQTPAELGVRDSIRASVLTTLDSKTTESVRRLLCNKDEKRFTDLIQRIDQENHWKTALSAIDHFYAENAIDPTISTAMNFREIVRKHYLS